MNIQLTLALRYLLGRKLRTALTTLAIVFGVLLIFGMNTILPAFVTSLQANALAAAGQVDVTITNRTNDAFSAGEVARVAAVPGVRVAAGSLERSINLQPDYLDGDAATPDRVAAVTLIGAEPDAIRAVKGYNIVEGRFLEASDRGAAVIAKSLAEAANLQLGDTLTLPTATGAVGLTVVGLTPQRLLPGNEEVLVTLSEAQALLDTPGQINVISANFDSTDEARRAEIEAGLTAALGSNYTLGVLQAGGEILTNIRTGQTMMNLIGFLGLLMGGFIIFNTFRTIIAERRRDIGLLRAIGASRGTVLGLILLEGLVQGVAGTAVGLLAGYLFSALLLSGLAPMMRQLLNVSLGAPAVSLGLIAVSVGMGVGITVLAGLLPARAASRLTPLEALRPAVGAVHLRRLAGLGFWSGVVMLALAAGALVSGNTTLLSLGAVLFTVGLILLAPALVNPVANLFGALAALAFARAGTAHLAEGNLSRQPGRAAVTASTTMIALAILVMAASLLSSVSITFTDMMRNSLGSDFLLVPPSVAVWGTNVGARPALADEIRALPGVGVVSTLRFAGAQIKGVTVGLLGIDPPAYTQTSGLRFAEGDAGAYAALSAGRNLIINGPLAAAAGVKLGDTVTVLTPGGEVAYQIVAIASDYLNAKTTTGYISQANLAADFGQTEDVFIQINAAPGAALPAVEAALKDTLKPYPQFRLIAGADFVRENSQLFDSMFIGMYAMLIFMAIPSLIAMVNTLAIGVLERTREIGMLRAVGATRGQVRTIILTEALILAAIGTALGLLAGLYLGAMAVSAMAAFGFPMTYVFPAGGLVAAVAVGLLFGALAAVWPARQATQLEVVRALRYE